MQDLVYLKPLSTNDTEMLHALLTVPAVYHYLADGVEPDRSVSIEWVESSVSDFDQWGVGAWSLFGKDGAAIRGIVRLSDFTHGAMELMYLLHPDLWGQGLATSMAHTALSRAFDTSYISSVWAGADKPNVASIAVMERLGMTYRKTVQYPTGEGVEYVMDRGGFDADQWPCLAVWP